MIKAVSFQSKEYQQLLELRNEILRIPLGMDIKNDPLHEEVEDVHIGYFKDQEALGVLVLRDVGNQTFKMRQVAVSNDYQRKGIGQKMILFSEKYALSNGFNLMKLNARDVAVPFYEKLSYQKVGTVFFEINIPHYKMIKKLK